MKNLSKLLMLCFLSFGIFSCSDDDDNTPQVATAPTLVEAAQANGLTTLLSAVGAVDGLGEALLAEDAITVFAPTNDAFAQALTDFNASSLDELVTTIGGVENLQTVLGFHVVPAVAFAADLPEGTNSFPTLSGQEISITRTGTSVTVTDTAGNTYPVVTADVEIENGVVHVIDENILLPELPENLPNLVEAAQANGLTTLLAAVDAVDGLGQTLLDANAITVFAPTNDAFSQALMDFNANDLGELITAIGGVDNLEIVLGFHVVPAVAFAGDLAQGDNVLTTLAGQDLTVNRDGMMVTVTDAGGNTYPVVTADVEIENGVVHVIDENILVPNL